MIDQYVPNLKKYTANFLEVGLLHTFETYDGDHTSKVAERIEQKVLPVVSTTLSFTAARR